MSTPLVTTNTQPTVAIIFNEKSGPEQVADIVSRQHAFVDYEVIDTVDENGRSAWLLLVFCETATPDQVFEMIGARLPDYIVARRFPTSRIAAARSATTST